MDNHPDKIQELKSWINDLVKYPIKINKQGELEKPIIIVGPSGDNENQLRVYAYGGEIGRISRIDDGQWSLAAKSYAKYIRCGGFTDGRSQKFEAPEWLQHNIEEIAEKYEKEKPEKILQGLLETIDPKAKKYYLVEEGKNYYLPLILAAQFSKWTNKKGQKKERRMQCEIVKEFQKRCGNKGEDLLYITDMEFDFALTKNRQEEKGSGAASKPDYVVFDGESFGLVEFKYNGQGYGNNNDLDVHFLDFYNLMYEATDEERWAKYKECIKRAEILVELEVLGNSESTRNILKNKLKKQNEYCENRRNGKFDEKLFWCGFYFVEGLKTAQSRIKLKLLTEKYYKNSKKFKENNEYYQNLTEKIETIEKKHSKIYACYSKEDNLVFDMTKSIDDILELKE